MRSLLAFALLLTLARLPAFAAVSPADLDLAQRWAAAQFAEVKEKPAVQAGLMVLANYRQIQRNARNGSPLKIGEEVFGRGIYCHAPSRILVRLPGPGKTFTTKVGIENNSQDVG